MPDIEKIDNQNDMTTTSLELLLKKVKEVLAFTAERQQILQETEESLLGTDIAVKLHELRQSIDFKALEKKYGQETVEKLQQSLESEEKAEEMVEKWEKMERKGQNLDEKFGNLFENEENVEEEKKSAKEQIIAEYFDENGEVSKEMRQEIRKNKLKKAFRIPKVQEQFKNGDILGGIWTFVKNIIPGVRRSFALWRFWGAGDAFMEEYKANKDLMDATNDAVKNIEEKKEDLEEEMGEAGKEIAENTRNARDVQNKWAEESLKPRIPYNLATGKNKIAALEQEFLQKIDALHKKHGKTPKFNVEFDKLSRKYAEKFNSFGIELWKKGGPQARKDLKEGFYKQYNAKLVGKRMVLSYAAGSLLKALKNDDNTAWGAVKQVGKELLTVENAKNAIIPFYDTKTLWKTARKSGKWSDYLILGIDTAFNVGTTIAIGGALLSGGVLTPLAGGMVAIRKLTMEGVKAGIKSAAKYATKEGAEELAVQGIKKVGSGKSMWQTMPNRVKKVVKWSSGQVLMQALAEEAIKKMDELQKAFVEQNMEQMYEKFPGMKVLEEEF